MSMPIRICGPIATRLDVMMPLHTFQCLNGHSLDQFIHVADDFGTRTALCEVCGETMSPRLSLGGGLLFFEQGRGRWIENLGPQPIFVTSPKQHRDLMKKEQVELAGERRGVPGWWV